jgi:hypothetical protein
MTAQPWYLVRDTVVPLAAPDPLLEAVQDMTGFQGEPLIASPPVRVTDGGKDVTEIELVVYAMATGAPPVPKTGTLDLQFIEIATVDDRFTALYPTPYTFIGRAPIIGLATGRQVIVPARYLYKFTVLLANVAVVGANRLQVWWRTYR